MTEIVVDTDVISFGFRNDSRFTFHMAHMQGLRPHRLPHVQHMMERAQKHSQHVGWLRVERRRVVVPVKDSL